MEQNLEQLLSEAEAAFRAKNFTDAQQAYLAILEQKPDSATAHYALGTIATYSKDFDKAVRSLSRAAELEPEGVDIAYNFAYCLSQLGERRGALLELQRASKYCRDDAVFCPRIAELLIHLGEPAAGLELLSRLGELQPDHQVMMSDAQGRLGRWREAVEILKRLHQAIPNEARVAEKLAIAAGNYRDYETAISAFESYLKLVRPSANDYLRFADLLLTAQISDRCDQALDQALSLGEDGPTVYVLKARVFQLNGDYKSAGEALDKAIERMPTHGQAWSMRAELAADDALQVHVQSLQALLQETGEIAKLNAHHQALLHYAHADMLNRLTDYDAAAGSYANANRVQHDYLKSVGNTYVAEQIEQHFNSIIDGFSIDVFDQADAKPGGHERGSQPVFIVGMPRSGTTLVERIIGHNDQVFSAGEQEAMDSVASDFRHALLTQKISDVSQVTPSQWSEFRQAYLDKLPEISKPVFTDKLPHNFRNVGLILKLFPEARVIQMRRSLQDVCLSVYTHAFTPTHNYANQWCDLKHFYQQSERLMNHWSGLNSPRILDLNYENLVRNPEHYAKQLIDFCGFSWDTSYLNFHQSINQSFTFSEMQVREPVSDKRVDRWRNFADAIPELANLNTH